MKRLLLSSLAVFELAIPAQAEGLPVGRSTRIRFTGQVPLASNLLMTLSFFSRSPAGGKAVRTANLQLRTRL